MALEDWIQCPDCRSSIVEVVAVAPGRIRLECMSCLAATLTDPAALDGDPAPR